MRIFLALILLSSCSLFEKRKSHFDYLSHGTLKSEILNRSGTPKRRSILGENKEMLVYQYCEVPYWKDFAGAMFTMTIYAWDCDKKLIPMSLYFENDSLVRVEDNGPPTQKIQVEQIKTP